MVPDSHFDSLNMAKIGNMSEVGSRTFAQYLKADGILPCLGPRVNLYQFWR